VKTFKNRFCRKCGYDFVPSGAKQYWCTTCGPKEKLKNSRSRSKARMQERRNINPVREKLITRKCTLGQKGWTPELYERTYFEQGGVCAICFLPLVNSNKESTTTETRLKAGCADHVHSAPPVPRGVLCSRCNALIAMAQDNQVVLASAVQYLRRYHG